MDYTINEDKRQGYTGCKISVYDFFGNSETAGEILSDRVTEGGRERPWRDKKIASGNLADIYDEVDRAKAHRVRECAQFVRFIVYASGQQRLDEANFCRVRLCPMCAWRRSLKIYAHTRKIIDSLRREEQYLYLMLTLTVPNVYGYELNSCIDNMMKAWHKFAGYKRFDNAVKGWYRGLEITHNVNKMSKSYDTYHPHFHCLFAVDSRYFKDSDYIKYDEWQALWKKALCADYDPVVDVRKVRGDTAAAIAEVAKYSVKDTDYIIPEDWELSVQTVRLLDEVLNRRRLVSYGKKFKEWHKKLNLDDELDGDLIHIDADAVGEDEDSYEMLYFWNVGYQQYISV